MNHSVVKSIVQFIEKFLPSHQILFPFHLLLDFCKSIT